MTKQYIITEAERDSWLAIMRNNLQDPDAYDAITELQSLPELTEEPVATMRSINADGEQRFIDWHKKPTPPAGTNLYTSPQPLHPITAEDVTDEMMTTYKDNVKNSHSLHALDMLVSAYNAEIKGLAKS